MPKSNALAAAVVGHILGLSTYTPPATYYLALCRVAVLPTDTGSTISEVAYTGYARVALTSASFVAVSAQSSWNATTITFATPGSNDTAYAWALCDAASGGNVLYYGTLPATPITAPIAPTVPVGGLVLTEA